MSNLTPAKRKARAINERLLPYLDRLRQQYPDATEEELSKICFAEFKDNPELSKLVFEWFFYDLYDEVRSQVVSEDGKAGTA